MYRILIAENIPSLNKGEMAILDGMMESLRVLGEVEVTMLSPRPEIDASRYGARLEVIDMNELCGFQVPSRGWFRGGFAAILVAWKHLLFLILYNVFGPVVFKFMKSCIWRRYVESDVILIGHDNAFNVRGINGPLFYPLYLPSFVKMLGKPVVLYGGSIGQLKELPWLLKKTFRLALAKLDLIVLRDSISYQNLKAFVLPNVRISVTADPAFLLRPAPAERIENIMRQEGIERESNLLFGMTATRQRGFMAFPDTKNTSQSYNKHVKVLAKVIDNLVEAFDAIVVFVPHCIGFDRELDDRIVAKDVFRECQTKERVKVITNEYSAAELKGLIGQFDFFIGERLHSVINAMSMEVPSIVISNQSDQRLDIIRMLKQDDSICFVENLDSEGLLTKIYDIWSNRHKVKKELESQTEVMRQQAMLSGRLLRKLLDVRQARDR